jgi:hypothetical protein
MKGAPDDRVWDGMGWDGMGWGGGGGGLGVHPLHPPLVSALAERAMPG